MDNENSKLIIVVVGASGDLARKKIFPALFTLYYQDLLPADLSVIGFARTDMTNDQFIETITGKLTCRTDSGVDCSEKMESFLKQTSYQSGQYGDEKSFVDLNKTITKMSNGKVVNIIFYMAIPPSIFLEVAENVGKTSMEHRGWVRLIIEKPFGRDSETSKQLNDGLGALFKEEQIYRIDHYLGKELVQNLMVMRFANLIFEPIWNAKYINNVQITWKEKIGVEGRGGYFDQYGIIRDVMQNHLMQILSLVAMEEPVSMGAEDIRNEKVKVLRMIPPLEAQQLVVGQYEGVGKIPGYTEDPSVPKESITPTYAAAVLHVNNRRWSGVPFLLRSGKGCEQNLTEIRISLKTVDAHIFSKKKEIPANEIVIRVQPNESIYVTLMNKIPGLNMEMDKSTLDMQYKQSFKEHIPDAYERLILDVVRGDKSLFIRNDELEAAWNIFTPTLKEMEENKKKPTKYPYASQGPSEAESLATKSNAKWG